MYVRLPRQSHVRTVGSKVRICFQARRFLCSNDSYGRKTFAEQPGNEIISYRRRIRRCEVVVHRHSLCLSSVQSSRLLTGMGIEIFMYTLLRDLHRIELPDYAHIWRIGVDD